MIEQGDDFQIVSEEMMNQQEFEYLKSMRGRSNMVSFVVPLFGTTLLLILGFVLYQRFGNILTDAGDIIIEDLFSLFVMIAAVVFILPFVIYSGIKQRKNLELDLQQPMKETCRIRLLGKKIEQDDNDHELHFDYKSNLMELDVAPWLYNQVEIGGWWILERAKVSDRPLRLYSESGNIVFFDYIAGLAPKRDS